MGETPNDVAKGMFQGNLVSLTTGSNFDPARVAGTITRPGGRVGGMRVAAASETFTNGDTIVLATLLLANRESDNQLATDRKSKTGVKTQQQMVADARGAAGTVIDGIIASPKPPREAFNDAVTAQLREFAAREADNALAGAPMKGAKVDADFEKLLTADQKAALTTARTDAAALATAMTDARKVLSDAGVALPAKFDDKQTNVMVALMKDDRKRADFLKAVTDKDKDAIKRILDAEAGRVTLVAAAQTEGAARDMIATASAQPAGIPADVQGALARMTGSREV
ncbi:MAG: hypothetical protein K2Q01_09530 [Rickettsiales bacterium]|nr:hypothetical protein [Rickettsiales bacterium]